MAEPSAIELRDALAEGRIRARELADRCLARVVAVDEKIDAWAHLDPDQVRKAADALDTHRASGRPIGPLHGVPVGIKDIIDVRGMPCENGTVLDVGRRPTADADLVEALKSAGALVMGKTVTTELAYFAPGRTRNPHDQGRTPGGSSSGSAAAVAAGMVPVAVGTQTNGSVIRPASFCGIVGFKPTKGLVSTRGAISQSPTLDTMGILTRTIEDAALLVDVMASCHPGKIQPPPGILETCRTAPPLAPRFAFVRSPVWERADAATRAGLEELAGVLGSQAETVELPEIFREGHAAQATIQMAELAKNYARYARRGREKLSPQMQAAIDRGAAISAGDYLRALDWVQVLNAGLDQIFDAFDAILTPAAVGEAPKDLGQTGDPVFCTLWTLCGTPAISLPLLKGEHDMPVGVQLVGRPGDDGRLLRTAAWLMRYLASGEPAHA